MNYRRCIGIVLLIGIAAACCGGCAIEESELKWYLRMSVYYCEGDDTAGEELVAAGYELPDCRSDN